MFSSASFLPPLFRFGKTLMVCKFCCDGCDVCMLLFIFVTFSRDKCMRNSEPLIPQCACVEHQGTSIDGGCQKPTVTQRIQRTIVLISVRRNGHGKMTRTPTQNGKKHTKCTARQPKNLTKQCTNIAKHKYTSIYIDIQWWVPKIRRFREICVNIRIFLISPLPRHHLIEA